MNRVLHAIAVIVVVGLAGCATAESSDAQRSPTGAPAPSLSAPTSVAAVAWPESCDDLVGPALSTELDELALVEGPTDDTIQGRFSGIGNGERWNEAVSCAYSAVDGREDRVEFGVEQLSPDDRAALLDVLRSGASENTTGLTEREAANGLLFTQTGAAASGSVPGDWAIAFAVYPEAWTMVWSPAGGHEVLAQHLSWSKSLEEQLYPG